MKTRIIIKNILFTLVTTVIILSALGKFAHRETVTSLFASLGMTDYMTRIAVIQLIIAGCLIFRPLRSLGVLVASAFLGGMIFMMMATDNSPVSAGLTLIVLWIAYKLEWWGYWKHQEDNDVCGCGWCKRSDKKNHHSFVTDCDCKDGACSC